MLKARIEQVSIKGFRSFENVDVKLSDLTVMIGANGSGKSNFIRFFEMLSWMLKTRKLGDFITRQGGADDQLFGGMRVTPRMEAEIRLRTDRGRNDYRFALAHAHPDRFFFTEEAFRFASGTRNGEPAWQHLGSSHDEARLVDAASLKEGMPGVNRTTARLTLNFLRNCAAYQFHDTSDASFMKQRWDVEDNARLWRHGGNLAAVLFRLEREDSRRYENICSQINRILPSFDRFAIEETAGKVLLRWKAQDFDKTIGAHLTSDGSLRFFALVTLLNLPPEMLPDVILLDEPELGLHPAAITLIGHMIKSVAREKQVIVATQSPLLVDVFQLENIVVLDMEGGRTNFHHLNPEEFAAWLEQDLTLGQMWQKNLFGGRP